MWMHDQKGMQKFQNIVNQIKDSRAVRWPHICPQTVDILKADAEPSSMLSYNQFDWHIYEETV